VHQRNNICQDIDNVNVIIAEIQAQGQL